MHQQQMALLRVVGLGLLASLLGTAALIVTRWLREPNRPLFVHALNVLLWPLMQLRVGPFKHSLTIAGGCLSFAACLLALCERRLKKLSSGD